MPGYSDSRSYVNDIDQVVTDSRNYNDGKYDRRDRNYRDDYKGRDDRRRYEREPYRSRDREPDRNSRPVNRERPSEREKFTNRNRENYGGYKIDFTNRPTLFDTSPPGYETTPVDEFKQLKATGALPVMAIPQGSTIVLRARRLLVEGLPKDVNQKDFLAFINAECHKRNIVIRPKDPVLSLEMIKDKDVVYLELRSAEETNSALELNGLMYKDNQLRIYRSEDHPQNLGYYYGCPHVFQDTLNKLFVACIPIYLNDDQVKELLTTFGELKAFNLVKDGATGLSKGYAFCEYRDTLVTDIAIAGLNGMEISDKKLVVQRAVLGSRQGTNLGGIIPSQMQVPGVDPDQVIIADIINTEVLCLVNMVTEEELVNDNDYQDILEDVKAECSKYGEVISIEIPRPGEGVNPESIGKIFVEFVTKEMSKEAYENLAGRKFAGRMVITTFYDLDKYHLKQF